MSTLNEKGISQEDIDAAVKTSSTEQAGSLDLLASSDSNCLICLQPYEQEEELRILDCKHGYHKECLDQWIGAGHNNCPMCRKPAIAAAVKPPCSRAAMAVSSLIQALTRSEPTDDVAETWRGPIPALVFSAESEAAVEGAGIMYARL